MNSSPQAEKNHAARSSVFWSALLTVCKLAAGLSTNSLGLLSEALHSLLDFVAASITWFAVRFASQPADAKHPFGHGKIENLSALAETILLFLTCGWIIVEALDRLFYQAAPVEPSIWAFGVIILSLVVDINRSAMLRRVAIKHRSQALEADALHFTTDIWSSAVVLLGLLCVAAVPYVAPGSVWAKFLANADALAALAVAGIVLGVSWKMARKAILLLMDGGLEKESQMLREALNRMAPLYAVLKLRVRESGSQYFVDLTVQAPPTLRVDAAHEVTDLLEECVRSILPDADVSIHVEPNTSPEVPDLYATTVMLAHAHGLDIHHLMLTNLHDGLHVLVDVELPGDLDLQQAHEKVSSFEKDVHRRTQAAHVFSHLEPTKREPAQGTAPAREQEVLNLLRHCMAQNPEVLSYHDICVWYSNGVLMLSCCCITSLAQTVDEAHVLASNLENRLKDSIPGLGRARIHMEPAFAEQAKQEKEDLLKQ